MTDARLVVGRCRISYRVPARATGGLALRVRLDGHFRDHGADQARQAVAGVVPAGDGVVVVRRASVRLKLGLAGSPEAVGRAWAAGLGAAVGAALRAGAPDVMRFPDRAAFMARFVEESVTGTAGSRWWLEPFGAWAHEPAAVAVAGVVRDEPAAAPGALAALARAGTLAWAAAAVGPKAAAAVLAALPDGVDEPIGLDALASAARGWPREARGLEDGESMALYLTGMVAAAKSGRPPGPGEAAAIRAVARSMGDVVSDLPPPGSPEAARVVETVLARARLHAPGPVPPDQAAAEARSGAGVTRFGGVFLLLPALASLMAEMAEVDRADDAAVRYAVLLACLGPGARYDEGLLAAAGLDALPHDVAAAVEPSTSSLADATGRAARRVAQGEPVDVAAGPMRVAVDDATGMWLHSAPSSDGQGADDAVGRDAAHVASTAPAVSHAAAVVLRRFALGLPGFGKAGFAHLAENVLTGAGRYTAMPDGLVASVPEAPLKVVLLLAGWRGSRHEVPWLPGGALLVEGEAG